MPPDLFDAEALLEVQAAAGVTRTVISDPHIWYGDLDPSAIERTREYNDFAAELVRAHPLRVTALATATPWRGDEHVREAERGVRELGLAGIAIPTSDGGRYLDTVPDGFWELVAELDVPVFIHPGGTVVGNELMQMYRLGEVCGRPLDTTVTLARFILTGTAERHPARAAPVRARGRGDLHDRRSPRLRARAPGLRAARPVGRGRAVGAAVGLRRAPLPRHRHVRHGGAPAAVARVGHERILYGSDRPPVPFDLERTLGYVRALGLPAGRGERDPRRQRPALFRLG